MTKPLKPGPIAVFISRKEGKIFVRKGFEPVFDAPVTFEQPDQPLGTHVYTALDVQGRQFQLALDGGDGAELRSPRQKVRRPAAS